MGLTAKELEAYLVKRKYQDSGYTVAQLEAAKARKTKQTVEADRTIASQDDSVFGKIKSILPSKKTVVDAARTIVPGVTGMMGGLIGGGTTLPTGPGAVAGAVAGSALGYAIGEEGVDRFAEYMLGTEQKPMVEELKEAGGRLAFGAATEYAGIKYIGPAITYLPTVLKGSKSLVAKLPKSVSQQWAKLGITKSARMQKAANIYVANTNNKTIITDSAKEAKRLTDGLGMKVSRGVIDGDTQTIRFEKGMQQTAEGGTRSNEPLKRAVQEDAEHNTKVLGDHIANAKGSTGEFADVEGMAIKAQDQADDAVATAQRALDESPVEFKPAKAMDSSISGKSMYEHAETSMAFNKAQASEKYAELDDTMRVDKQALLDKLNDIAKPQYAKEGAENFPSKLTERIASLEKMIEEGEPLHLAAAQGWRSEVLDAARQGVSRETTSSRQALKRLNSTADALKDSVNPRRFADNPEGAKLAEINKLYQESVVDLFYKGEVANILKGARNDRNTLFTLQDRFFKPGNTGRAVARDFNKVYGDNPTIKAELIDSIDQNLRKSIHTGSGDLKPGNVTGWKNKHKEALDELGLTQRYEDAEAVGKAYESAVNAQKEFEKTAASRMLENQVDDVAKTVMTGKVAQNYDEMFKIVKDSPDAIAGLNNSIVDHMWATASKDLNPGQLNAQAYMNIVDKNSVIMRKMIASGSDGSAKVKALSEARKAIEMINKKVDASDIDINSIIENAFGANVKAQRTGLPKWIGNAIMALGHGFHLSDKAVIKTLNRAVMDPDFALALKKMGTLPPGTSMNDMLGAGRTAFKGKKSLPVVTVQSHLANLGIRVGKGALTDEKE